MRRTLALDANAGSAANNLGQVRCPGPLLRHCVVHQNQALLQTSRAPPTPPQKIVDTTRDLNKNNLISHSGAAEPHRAVHSNLRRQWWAPYPAPLSESAAALPPSVKPPEGMLYRVAGEDVDETDGGASRHHAAPAGYGSAPKPRARLDIVQVHRARVHVSFRSGGGGTREIVPRRAKFQASDDVEDSVGGGADAAVPASRGGGDHAPVILLRIVLLNRCGSRTSSGDVDLSRNGGDGEFLPREEHWRFFRDGSGPGIVPERRISSDYKDSRSDRGNPGVRGEGSPNAVVLREESGDSPERGGGIGGIQIVEAESGGEEGGIGGGDGEESVAEEAAVAAEEREGRGEDEAGPSAADEGEAEERGGRNSGEALQEEVIGEGGDRGYGGRGAVVRSVGVVERRRFGGGGGDVAVVGVGEAGFHEP